MSIRAVDLPEMRSAILDHYQHPDVVDWWSKRPTSAAVTVYAENGSPWASWNPTGNDRRLQEIQRLSLADLFFVTAHMTDLAMAAAQSLPAFDLARSDCPSESGFIIFEKPIDVDRNERGGHGEEVFVSGASWNLEHHKAAGLVLWFSFYADSHLTFDADAAAGGITVDEAERQKRLQPRYTYTADAAHVLGSPMNEDSVLNSWGRTILATWLLMGQDLTAVSRVDADRAARKRMVRAGYEPRSVRLIELRRPRGSAEAGDGSREYQHQWIVRGHWRQQWYPTRQVHRPVWIAPHVKGPNGAPLIGGEKVNVLKR
ncbi:hypothetical protein [Streptomyces sp. NPDC001665]